MNTTLEGVTGYSHLMNNTSGKPTTSAEEFWHYNVLEMSPGIDSLGGIQWKLLGCLILSWVIVFACLIKGVKSSGKVVYVTATVPYIFLTILLIRGMLLPGAMDGIRYYVSPDWSKLLEFRVWVEACLQIFYSLGPAWGGLITMASYNKFNNNVYRDAILVPVINCGTSFFAGFVIFSIIGFMAHEADLPIKEVITSGPGLAFMAYPEAITKLPISPFWAVMFFLMLLTIGLDSQFAMFETMVSGFIDRFPQLLRVFKKKLFFTAFCALVQFTIGLPLVTKAGIYFFQVIDWYSGAFSVTLIAVLECLVIAYVYGANRLRYDISLMIGYTPSILWVGLWCFVTPALLILILIVSMTNFPEPMYGNYKYPSWAIGIGWLTGMMSIFPIPAVAIYQIATTEGTLLQRIKFLLQPAPEWGPALGKYRESYNYMPKSICPRLSRKSTQNDTDDRCEKVKVDCVSRV